MKKIFFITVIVSSLIFSKNSCAQFDNIGGGIVIGTGGEYKLDGSSYYNKPFGINVRASYKLNKKINIVPAFNIYLPNTETFAFSGESKTIVYAFNLNSHYIVNHRSRDNYRLYILVGAHVSGWDIKDTRSTISGPNTLDVKEFTFSYGANIGGGMKFHLGNRTQFFAEAKYVIAKTNQLVFNPGLLFEF